MSECVAQQQRAHSAKVLRLKHTCRCSTTQAQKQLEQLHNASKWLLSTDVGSETRHIKLLLSYLAYADLSHEQIVESHISAAVQLLTQVRPWLLVSRSTRAACTAFARPVTSLMFMLQHTDADIQKAAAHCLSKWQLTQQAHQYPTMQDFMATQQY